MDLNTPDDLSIPSFLDRSKWTKEDFWRNEDAWDIRIERGREEARRKAAIIALEKSIRDTERKMSQVYGMLSRYFEGTTSHKMTQSRAESYNKKLAELKAEYEQKLGRPYDENNLMRVGYI